MGPFAEDIFLITAALKEGHISYLRALSLVLVYLLVCLLLVGLLVFHFLSYCISICFALELVFLLFRLFLCLSCLSLSFMVYQISFFFFFLLFFNKIWNLSEANTPISARINCKSSRVSLNRTGFSTKLNLIPIFPTVTNSIHCFIDPITILAGLLLHRSYKETNESFWICLLRISNWWFARYEQLQRPIWCISDQTQAVSVTVSSSGATIWYQH